MPVSAIALSSIGRTPIRLPPITPSTASTINGIYMTADSRAREGMLLGAHLAGAAIENSMLGAAHALANGLTAVCGTVHGVAVGLMLPHVVRFNAAAGENPYADLEPDAQALARRIDTLLSAGNLPRTLKEAEVEEKHIPIGCGKRKDSRRGPKSHIDSKIPSKCVMPNISCLALCRRACV